MKKTIIQYILTVILVVFIPNAHSLSNQVQYSIYVKLAKYQFEDAEKIYYWGSMVPLTRHCDAKPSKGKVLVQRAVMSQKKWIMLAASNLVDGSYAVDRHLFNKYLKVFNKGFSDGERKSNILGWEYSQKLRYGEFCEELMPYLTEEPEYYYPDAQ